MSQSQFESHIPNQCLKTIENLLKRYETKLAAASTERKISLSEIWYFQLFIYGAYCRPSKPLTAEFSTFIDDQSSRGTILIAFGTIVDWAHAPREKLDAFVDALNELSEYRIIWSYGGPEIRTKKHIKLVRWLPQNDILNDNRTKLFITHGGLKRFVYFRCC